MKIGSNKLLSLKPRFYGKKILARFGLGGPPIDEKVIAHNLGLEIRLIDGSEVSLGDVESQNFLKK